jgi:hypothetical protein
MVWTMIAAVGTKNDRFVTARVTLFFHPLLNTVRIDSIVSRKNQKLFSKTSSQTVDQERGSVLTLSRN